MRRCSNGHEVADDGFDFCPKCGQPLTQPASAESEPAPEEPPVGPVAEPDSRAAAAEAFGENAPAEEKRRRNWPLSVGWTIVVAVFTFLSGLLALFSVYLWRTGHKAWAGVFAAVFVGLVALVLIGIVGGGSGSTGSQALANQVTTTVESKPKPLARRCSSYHGATKPQTCIDGTGAACSTYTYAKKPNDCLTASEVVARQKVRHAHLVAAAKARQRRLIAAAKARQRRLVLARERAKARAAAIAAANAWHQGYFPQDENVYWKWINGGSCQDYATNGCFHVAVITQNGCPSYVAVNANEYQGSAIVGSLLANQGYGIPPKTERVFELDADAPNVTANNVTIDCN